MHNLRRYRRLFLLLLVLSLVGCDHASKRWAKRALSDSPAVSVIDNVLDLRYAENVGVSFSMLSNTPASLRRPLVIGMQLCALAIVLVFWLRFDHQRRLLSNIAFSLIVAGALGNLLDRGLWGFVVDFIHLRRWPIFNIADTLVVTGGLLLLMLMLIKPAKAEPV